MVKKGCVECPDCGGQLEYYDKIKRYVRIENGKRKVIFLRRLRCAKCRRIHRELKNIVFPYKQYSAYIIRGFMRGELNNYILEYEDYPCESTIKLWTQKMQIL